VDRAITSHDSWYIECTPGYTPTRGSSSSSRVLSRVTFVARHFAPSRPRLRPRRSRSIVHSCPVASSFVGHALDRETRPRAGGTNDRHGHGRATAGTVKGRFRPRATTATTTTRGVQTTPSPSPSARVVSRVPRFLHSLIRSRDSSDRPTGRGENAVRPLPPLGAPSVARVGRARRPARSRRRLASTGVARTAPTATTLAPRANRRRDPRIVASPPLLFLFLYFVAAASRCLFPSPSTTRARPGEGTRRRRRRSHRRRRRRDRSVERRRARVDSAPSTRDVVVASRGGLCTRGCGERAGGDSRDEKFAATGRRFESTSAKASVKARRAGNDTSVHGGCGLVSRHVGTVACDAMSPTGETNRRGPREKTKEWERRRVSSSR